MASLETNIERAVLQAITTRVQEMVEEEDAKCLDGIRQRIREETAGVAAAVFKNVSIERMGMDLCIRIQDKIMAVVNSAGEALFGILLERNIHDAVAYVVLRQIPQVKAVKIARVPDFDTSDIVFKISIEGAA